MKNNQMYNYLHGTNIYLYQRADMFRINTDTFLLGKFYKIKDNDIVLDIGCNNGALLLYSLDKKSSNNKLIGVDIQKEAIELAKENFELNKVDFELYCVDIRDFKYDKVDCIICNPPYFEYNKDTNVKQNESLTIARFEKYCPLDELCSSFRRLIKDTGHIYMVHRANSLTRIINELTKNNLCIDTMQLVYDKDVEYAISVLLDITVGDKTITKILKPQIIQR
mgnify:CR=1 FL=1